MKSSSLLHTLAGVCVNLLRFVLAATFILSGFVKAVDPLGTVYKLGDYAEAFGWGTALPAHGVLMLMAMGLCLFEFVMGICILFAIWRRTALTAAVAFLSVMTPLTFYLALANPVADCGCFGDAIVLTNWQTFWKNVVLLTMAIIVLINHERMVRLIHRNAQWIIGAFAIVSICLFMQSNLRHLPLFDFRPYRVGTDFEQAMAIPDDAKQPRYTTFFTLTKDGVTREFSLDDYPDSTWAFVSSRTVLEEKGYEPPIHDFALIDADGDDITSNLFDPGWSFLLVMNKLQYEDMLDIINDLYDYAAIHDCPFYALTSATNDDIERWRTNTGAGYDFFTADDITLKTIVRSNPGLLLVKDGTIVGKWSKHDIPRDIDFSLAPEQQEWVTHYDMQHERRMSRTLFIMIFPYVFIALLDYLIRRKKY